MRFERAHAAGIALLFVIAGCQSMQPTVFPIESAASVDGRPLERRPELIAGTCQAPPSPVTMQQSGASGEATLGLVVDTLGIVEAGSITVTAATAPDLADPAKAAVATCRFTPGLVAGRPVRTRVVQKVKFHTP